MIISTLRLVYSLVLMLLLPIIFLRLWFKGRAIASYRERWSERLGIVSFIIDKRISKPIWVHAASVGEVLAAVPLIRSLQNTYPNTPILVTTMTATGSERVQIAFKNELNNTIFHSYLPYDVGCIINRFISNMAPRALIIIETELWPNVLHYAHKQSVPIIIANGRLSPASVKQYRYLGNIMHHILSAVTLVATQSSLDAQRYASIGMPVDRIINTGNLKYDVTLPDDITEKGHVLRRIWDKDKASARCVWIAASTHEGEEALILSIFAKLKLKYPSLLLLLVPRHPNRFDTVYQLCVEKKWSVQRRTAIINNPANHLDNSKNNIDIFLGDTMGELLNYYAASDLVLMGGSLIPIGGHNYLEPAALGLAMITGPYDFNFTEITQNLIAQGGLRKIESKDKEQLEAQLLVQLEDLLNNPQTRQQMGKAAYQVVQQNRGALDRLMKLIQTVCG